MQSVSKQANAPVQKAGESKAKASPKKVLPPGVRKIRITTAQLAAKANEPANAQAPDTARGAPQAGLDSMGLRTGATLDSIPTPKFRADSTWVLGSTIVSSPGDSAQAVSDSLAVSERENKLAALFGWCDEALGSYTVSEAEANINGKGLMNELKWLVAKIVVVDKETAKELLARIKLIEATGSPPGFHTESYLKDTVGMFPDSVVKRYARNLKDEDCVISKFKRDYSSLPEGERRAFYLAVQKLEAAPSFGEMEKFLYSGEGGRAQFPMLSFYFLLFSAYDEKNNRKNSPRLREIFAKGFQKFLSESARIARSSGSFEEFETGLKG